MRQMEDLTVFHRLQKGRQSGDHTSHDEDGHVAQRPRLAAITLSSDRCLGHVEKTNDRDYEVEER